MCRTHRIAALLALALLAFTPGCVLAAAALVGGAVGAVSYANNEAWMDFKEPMPEVWDATLRAMRALGHGVEGDPQPGPTEGVIESGETRVAVERHAGGYVRVRARVGTFDTPDNERRAKLILERVREEIGRR